MREVFLGSLTEAEDLGLADTTRAQALTRTDVLEARKKWQAVQELKSQGFSQSQASKELGIPESTLRRLWHQADKN